MCSPLISLTVRVCNCTELGYCYMPPGRHGHIYGMGATVGILVGTLAFCGKPEKKLKSVDW